MPYFEEDWERERDGEADTLAALDTLLSVDTFMEPFCVGIISLEFPDDVERCCRCRASCLVLLSPCMDGRLDVLVIRTRSIVGHDVGSAIHTCVEKTMGYTNAHTHTAMGPKVPSSAI